MIMIEHLYILGVVLIYMLIVIFAVWRIKDVDIEEDNFEAFRRWMEDDND